MRYQQRRLQNLRKSWRQESGCRESISIKLYLGKKQEKQTYESGSTIQGNISLFVPQSAAGTNYFSALHVSLNGLETRIIPNKVLTKGEDATEVKIVTTNRYDRNIAEIDTEVIQLPSPLVAGQYEYPFSLQLPKALPTSMECKSKDFSSSMIHYNLTAYLRASSSTVEAEYTVIRPNQPIEIASSGGYTIYSKKNNRVSQAKKFSIKSWMKNKGFIELGYEKKKIESSNTISLAVSGRNCSSVSVEKLLVQLVETVQWNSKVRKFESQRILGETSVSVLDSPSWQKQSEERNNTIVHLQMSKKARESYIGHTIQIRHTLNITAIVKGKCSGMPVYKTFIEFRAKPNKSTPTMVQAQLLSQLNEAQNDEQAQYDEVTADVSIPVAYPVMMDTLIAAGEAEQDESSESSNSVSSSICFHPEPILVMGVA